ncbi:hypothetical protein N7519_002167 [Penicillium mononematosum]|uniref:uncharacterized protein n=1 Tax=Penicillium mononematosum TaxID=268346 RepID=UPI0025480E0A|nr:uncharacterized protein N7519_002167 [Penicillium mononematosum]KAJ6187259.1 hypothetical protein N7519_002167 [Penicillium mononematosum]
MISAVLQTPPASVSDQGSSSICCPAGSDCNYISPITCDIQQQDVTIYPESVIKTTRLGDSLPKCGDACCPICIQLLYEHSIILDNGYKLCNTPGNHHTRAIPSSEKSSNSTTCAAVSTSCPSFPAGAIAAGFFPGAVFGAVAALLITLCFRRARKDECEIQEGKTGPNWSQRSSSGAILCISNPIPQDDTSYRTDFLRSPPRAKRSSIGGRSTRTMIHRTGSRVRSLFSGYPRQNPQLDKDVPPIPMPNPVASAPFTPPRQRQPSTESIKVYSPPESLFLQNRNRLGPEPYPGSAARPDTLFSNLMRDVGTPQGGKGKVPYPTHDDNRENPFRDPVR